MDFVRWALELSETYNVAFGVGETVNERDIFIKEGNVPANDAWVICPECDDPIYRSDCEYMGNGWECPCCGFMEENE